MQGKNGKDFVAVDEFEFLQSEVCELKPPEAKPIVPTTQPPTPPTTTPEPTEPPGRKFIKFFRLGSLQGKFFIMSMEFDKNLSD